MSLEERLRWAEVEPLGAVNGALSHVLASVDTLREAWDLSLTQASDGDFAEARRRSLRRHAIETGIIERLYDVDWGVTEALVAEGITADVAAREGGLDDDALAIIRSQYEALEFLADAARNNQDLSLHFYSSAASSGVSYTAPVRGAQRFRTDLAGSAAPRHLEDAI